MSYTPNQSKYLTVAQAKNNRGTKDIKIILDTDTNVLYSLDDDNNFETIQFSEYTIDEFLLFPNDIELLDLGYELLPALDETQYYDIEYIILEGIASTTNWNSFGSLNIKYNDIIIGQEQGSLLSNPSTSNRFCKIFPYNFSEYDGVSETFSGSKNIITPNTAKVELFAPSTPAGGDYLLKVIIKYKINTYYTIPVVPK
jgi:hypothetical protein